MCVCVCVCLLDSRDALSNSYPNAYMPMQGGSLYHLMVFSMTYCVRGEHADH